MRKTISFTLLATAIGVAVSLGGGTPAIGQPSRDSAAHESGESWVRWYGSREKLRTQFPGINGGIDYGSFQWLPASALDAQTHNPAAITGSSSNPFELDLGGQRFDPLSLPPMTTAPGEPGWQRSEDADWRLLQFNGPIKGEWLDALRAAGVEPVQYIHPFTYVVWAEASAMTRSALPESVRWSGEYPPEFRVAPLFRSSNRAVVEMQAMIRAGDPGILDALREVGAEVVSSNRTDRHFDGVLLRAPASSTLALAAVPGVYTVQPVATDGGIRGEMSAQISADNLDGAGVAFTGYQNYLADIGLDGSGVIMACVDNGTQANHADLTGRMLPCAGPSCGGGNQTDGHGTHVAGIMAGDASSGVIDTLGFLRGQGMAPAARLVEQRDSRRPGVDGMLNLMRDSVRNNATISNNSWGPAASPRGYDMDTRYTDIGVRDADIDAEGDQPLTYVLAIMNGRGGTSSQGSPDEAKNLFTIGSTWAQTNAGAQDMRYNHISANSGHGPALDGRFIPHMVTSGCSVDSTVGTSYGVNGWCGTSMAAPHVAGASALFTQYYREQYEAEPSPALIKAAFIARARDLVGNNDANNNPIGARPDSKQGWGRMQLSPVVAPELPVVYIDQNHVFDETGQTWQATYSAADPEQPMQLMLVWTDAPGHGNGGSTPAWNNDLDLRVSAGEDLYLGNVFADGWSVTGGSADDRNNTEGVFLQSAQHGGAISVEVLAANINSNALPNAGEDNAQDFALVCYNCVAAPAASSDLALNMTDVPDPVIAGETLTYVFGVSNFGPDAANNVQLSLTLPDAASYTVNRSLGDGPDWQCLTDDTEVVCSLPEPLTAASQAPLLEVDVQVAVNAAPGIIRAEASVSSDSADPQPENDQAQEATQVLRAPERLFDDGFECAEERPGC